MPAPVNGSRQRAICVRIFATNNPACLLDQCSGSIPALAVMDVAKKFGGSYGIGITHAKNMFGEHNSVPVSASAS